MAETGAGAKGYSSYNAMRDNTIHRVAPVVQQPAVVTLGTGKAINHSAPVFPTNAKKCEFAKTCPAVFGNFFSLLKFFRFC